MQPGLKPHCFDAFPPNVNAYADGDWRAAWAPFARGDFSFGETLGGTCVSTRVESGSRLNTHTHLTDDNDESASTSVDKKQTGHELTDVTLLAVARL